MTKIYKGNLKGEGLKIGIVVSRFNKFITQKLLDGCLEALEACGVKNIEVFWVPGAFEIPLILQKIAQSKKYDGLVCLGAVIRGATPHFEYVANESIKGTASVIQKSGLPCAMGILTCDNIEQAIERAGTKAGNKGYEAGQVVVEMVNLIKKIRR